MFCEKCGTPLNEGDTFCPNCGAPVAAAKPAEAAPASNPDVNPTTAMVWGILALALCEIPIAGLIIAIIARKKVKAYYAAGGALCPQSKIGSALSKAGLILSIVLLVCYVIIGVVAGCTAALAAASEDIWEAYALLSL